MSDLSNPGCFPSTANQTGKYKASPTLPPGRWHVMANGRIHFLTIASVSGGEVTGDYNGEPLVGGQWDAAGQVLTFYRYIADVGGGRRLLQLFTGHLMQYDKGTETKWRMAGILIGTATSPPSDPDSPRGGWYATLDM